MTKFSVGDHIGVGCMVDSCLECSKCMEGQEQKCSFVELLPCVAMKNGSLGEWFLDVVSLL